MSSSEFSDRESDEEDEEMQCPLCCEEMDLADRSFHPCHCGFQICLFCYNKLKEETTEEGKFRCPNCRTPYTESSSQFTPPDPELVIRERNEKKLKEKHGRKHATIIASRKHLAKMRVLQRNLVYVIGLPPSIAQEEILRSHEYFGRYGTIVKLVINSKNLYSSAPNPSVGAYITFEHQRDAERAIDAINQLTVEGKTLKASFGTTKYCSYYLEGRPCPKKDCMYLHELGAESDSFTKEELTSRGFLAAHAMPGSGAALTASAQSAPRASCSPVYPPVQRPSPSLVCAGCARLMHRTRVGAPVALRVSRSMEVGHNPWKALVGGSPSPPRLVPRSRGTTRSPSPSPEPPSGTGGNGGGDCTLSAARGPSTGGRTSTSAGRESGGRTASSSRTPPPDAAHATHPPVANGLPASASWANKSRRLTNSPPTAPQPSPSAAPASGIANAHAVAASLNPLVRTVSAPAHGPLLRVVPLHHPSPPSTAGGVVHVPPPGAHGTANTNGSAILPLPLPLPLPLAPSSPTKVGAQRKSAGAATSAGSKSAAAVSKPTGSPSLPAAKSSSSSHPAGGKSTPAPATTQAPPPPTGASATTHTPAWGRKGSKSSSKPSTPSASPVIAAPTVLPPGAALADPAPAPKDASEPRANSTVTAEQPHEGNSAREAETGSSSAVARTAATSGNKASTLASRPLEDNTAATAAPGAPEGEPAAAASSSCSLFDSEPFFVPPSSSPPHGPLPPPPFGPYNPPPISLQAAIPPAWGLVARPGFPPGPAGPPPFPFMRGPSPYALFPPAWAFPPGGAVGSTWEPVPGEGAVPSPFGSPWGMPFGVPMRPVTFGAASPASTPSPTPSPPPPGFGAAPSASGSSEATTVPAAPVTPAIPVAPSVEPGASAASAAADQELNIEAFLHEVETTLDATTASVSPSPTPPSPPPAAPSQQSQQFVPDWLSAFRSFLPNVLISVENEGSHVPAAPAPPPPPPPPVPETFPAPESSVSDDPLFGLLGDPAVAMTSDTLPPLPSMTSLAALMEAATGPSATPSLTSTSACTTTATTTSPTAVAADTTSAAVSSSAPVSAASSSTSPALATTAAPGTTGPAPPSIFAMLSSAPSSTPSASAPAPAPSWPTPQLAALAAMSPRHGGPTSTASLPFALSEPPIRMSGPTPFSPASSRVLPPVHHVPLSPRTTPASSSVPTPVGSGPSPAAHGPSGATIVGRPVLPASTPAPTRSTSPPPSGPGRSAPSTPVAHATVGNIQRPQPVPRLPQPPPSPSRMSIQPGLLTTPTVSGPQQVFGEGLLPLPKALINPQPKKQAPSKAVSAGTQPQPQQPQHSSIQHGSAQQATARAAPPSSPMTTDAQDASTTTVPSFHATSAGVQGMASSSPPTASTKSASFWAAARHQQTISSATATVAVSASTGASKPGGGTSTAAQPASTNTAPIRVISNKASNRPPPGGVQPVQPSPVPKGSRSSSPPATAHTPPLLPPPSSSSSRSPTATSSPSKSPAGSVRSSAVGAVNAAVGNNGEAPAESVDPSDPDGAARRLARKLAKQARREQRRQQLIQAGMGGAVAEGLLDDVSPPPRGESVTPPPTGQTPPPPPPAGGKQGRKAAKAAAAAASAAATTPATGAASATNAVAPEVPLPPSASLPAATGAPASSVKNRSTGKGAANTSASPPAAPISAPVATKSPPPPSTATAPPAPAGKSKKSKGSTPPSNSRTPTPPPPVVASPTPSTASTTAAGGTEGAPQGPSSKKGRKKNKGKQHQPETGATTTTAAIAAADPAAEPIASVLLHVKRASTPPMQPLPEPVPLPGPAPAVPATPTPVPAAVKSRGPGAAAPEQPPAPVVAATVSPPQSRQAQPSGKGRRKNSNPPPPSQTAAPAIQRGPKGSSSSSGHSASPVPVVISEPQSFVTGSLVSSVGGSGKGAGSARTPIVFTATLEPLDSDATETRDLGVAQQLSRILAYALRPVAAVAASMDAQEPLEGDRAAHTTDTGASTVGEGGSGDTAARAMLGIDETYTKDDWHAAALLVAAAKEITHLTEAGRASSATGTANGAVPSSSPSTAGSTASTELHEASPSTVHLIEAVVPLAVQAQSQPDWPTTASKHRTAVSDSSESVLSVLGLPPELREALTRFAAHPAIAAAFQQQCDGFLDDGDSSEPAEAANEDRAAIAVAAAAARAAAASTSSESPMRGATSGHQRDALPDPLLGLGRSLLGIIGEGAPGAASTASAASSPSMEGARSPSAEKDSAGPVVERRSDDPIERIKREMTRTSRELHALNVRLQSLS